MSNYKHPTYRYLDEAGDGDAPTPGDSGGATETPPADTGTEMTATETPPADTGQQGTGTAYFASLPDDWRSQAVDLLGEMDDSDRTKRLGQLERFTDLGSVLRSGFEAQDRIRKGEVSNGLPENPSEEQLAAWREANGVPATAADYELSLEEGLVLGEEDTGVLEGVFEVAHQYNIPTEAMSAMTNAMLKGREAVAQQMTSQDGMDEQNTTRQIREAWGSDYDVNINLIRGLVAKLPATVREQFESARLADGRAVFNSPEMLVFFADMARELNPSATVVPGSNNPIQSIENEIAELESKMGTEEWYKDKQMQQRYMDLLDAKAKMNNAA